MTYRLKHQAIEEIYEFQKIEIEDITKLSIVMLDSIKGTCEYVGETLKDIVEEIDSVVSGSFAPYIFDASYQIKQKDQIVAAIMISFYEGYPLISEIFTKKQNQGSGMAASLIKKSVNSLLEIGYKELTLNVEPRNTAALNLYEKIGFEKE
ncbi:MAG: GNAT family N-acetyltransferase [Clostridiaceae bacterium]|nr:GNAT family N-acetyltransferase [Clostridiaceae bacterium]